jgi:hypothetical protein
MWEDQSHILPRNTQCAIVNFVKQECFHHTDAAPHVDVVKIPYFLYARSFARCRKGRYVTLHTLSQPLHHPCLGEGTRQ